jgi:hypothetical protein
LIRRRRIVRRTLLAALALFFASAGIAQAQTLTGRVASSAETAPRGASTVFRTGATGDIAATLHWRWLTPSANLNLYLARHLADGSWRRVAQASSLTAHPKHLLLRSARPGEYRFRVRAVSGQSPFRLEFTADEEKPPPPQGPFLTLLFSRSEIGTATRCVPDPTGSANLMTVVAPELARRGLRPTGSVETGITQNTARACVHYRRTLAASWADLTRLRDSYGWAFVSHGRTWATNLASMTEQQQWSDTCGSLLDLERHGFWTADGLFAFPNNRWSEEVQANVVSTCFAFGRRYGSGTTSRTTAMASPYWQSTQGTSGGRCNDPALPCASLHTITTYRSPDRIRAELASLGTNQWLTLQSYVLVTGDRPGEWRCNAADWHLHWSTDAERYCWSDYVRILDGIPSGITVTDPKTVAKAWGRTNYRVPMP